MKIGPVELASPLVLAPLAGYTVPPFRALCRRLGASLTFTEMVSAAGLIKSRRASFPLLERAPGEEPLGVQLFGADPELISQAGAMMVDLGFQVIDLNFACPVPKVTRSGAGAALLNDHDRAVELVTALRPMTTLPVTVKLRLGWDRFQVLDLLPRLAQAGVAAVTVHGRTRQQGYSGQADWVAIGRCREILEGAVPLFGSGDLFTPSKCREVLEREYCDGIHLARGALNNPWLFRQTSRYLAGQGGGEPAPEEKHRAGREILAWLMERKGEPGGVQAFRGFFSRLVKGTDGAKELRRQIYQALTTVEVDRVLVQAFGPL